MTRHIITILLCLLASNAFAGKFWFQNPETPVVPANPVYLLHNKTTATDHTVTDTVLRNHMQPTTDETLTAIGQPTDTPLSVQPATGTNPYQRKLEVKDSTGKITMFATANGTMVFGTPAALAVASVSPVNGAIGVDVNAVPTITFNKQVAADINTIYLVGRGTAPVASTETPAVWYIPAAPLSPGTVYTVRVIKNNLVQTDGETTSSCGPMPEVAGVCQSTFTTARAPLSIVSTYPGPGATNVPGTPGQVMDPDIAIEFDRPLTDYSAVVTDMVVTASKWNGTAYVNYTLFDYPAISSDSLIWNGGAQYMASTDASHLTTYTVQIKKRIGLTSCPSAWTDTGTICQYQFTTAP